MDKRSPTIGVLALQGAFREHASALRRLGAEVVEIRRARDLDGLDGLVIPGGESTAMLLLARETGLDEGIRTFARPILGTCAGLILLGRDHLGVADVEVERNAYGRQVASFEADLAWPTGGEPLRGVFIRAPRVTAVGGGVETLIEHHGAPVLLRDGDVLLTSFHPELTDDPRVHALFLERVTEAMSVRA